MEIEILHTVIINGHQHTFTTRELKDLRKAINNVLEKEVVTIREKEYLPAPVTPYRDQWPWNQPPQITYTDDKIQLPLYIGDFPYKGDTVTCRVKGF